MSSLSNKTNIPLHKFIKYIEGYSYNNQIICVHLSPFSNSNIGEEDLAKNKPKEKKNAMGFMIVMSGFIEMTIDYIPYKFERNAWIELRPGAKVEITNLSNNLSAYLVLVTETFIIDTLLDKKPIPVSHYADKKDTPSLILKDNELADIKASVDRIFHYLKIEHNYKKDMLHNTFYNLILEGSNIFANRERDRERPTPATTSRRESILRSFLVLVEQNAAKEHNPSFYSDKLCISTQYLSIILKERTGKTANYWIAKRIITEAKTLLRTPHTTIKEITSSLNFADQSSFGKFFKKHTGISPKKYKEEYATPK